MESECQTDRSYTSVSPLPSTLLCCPRDDTVCAYCGVSYLVLHEIADLEAKIVLLEQNQTAAPGEKTEADWARGALQAACHALVQRELGDARAKAEARIQSLAEAYEEERIDIREQLRQVSDLARSVWDAAQRLEKRALPLEQQELPCARLASGGPARALRAAELLEGTALCLGRLDSALRSSSEEQQAAGRRARQAETDLVQARVQTVRLQEEAQRLRAEADQLGLRLGVHEQEQARAVSAARSEAQGKAARARERIRTLTGQAELWRSVARTLEGEKVVLERELSDLRERLALAQVEPCVRLQEEDKRRNTEEFMSLKGALKDSHEEIAALQGQKHALQAALRSMENSSRRGAKERQELLSALNNARQTLRLESERRCAMMADECRRLGEERCSERSAWERERSRLVAERARVEAEAAELRNTCLTLQVRAEQSAQELLRMEDTVLKQCEERDTLLRSLTLPAASPAPSSPDTVQALADNPEPPRCPGDERKFAGLGRLPAGELCAEPEGEKKNRIACTSASPPPSQLPKQAEIPFTIDAVRPPNNRRTAPSRRAKKSQSDRGRK